MARSEPEGRYSIEPEKRERATETRRRTRTRWETLQRLFSGAFSVLVISNTFLGLLPLLAWVPRCVGYHKRARARFAV